jgi:hypothetical protein
MKVINNVSHIHVDMVPGMVCVHITGDRDAMAALHPDLPSTLRAGVYCERLRDIDALATFFDDAGRLNEQAVLNHYTEMANRLGIELDEIRVDGLGFHEYSPVDLENIEIGMTVENGDGLCAATLLGGGYIDEGIRLDVENVQLMDESGDLHDLPDILWNEINDCVDPCYDDELDADIFPINHSFSGLRNYAMQMGWDKVTIVLAVSE